MIIYTNLTVTCAIQGLYFFPGCKKSFTFGNCFLGFFCVYYIFRQVIEGTDTLKAIESADTMNERPMKDIKVTDCGTLEFVF